MAARLYAHQERKTLERSARHRCQGLIPQHRHLAAGRFEQTPSTLIATAIALAASADDVTAARQLDAGGRQIG